MRTISFGLFALNQKHKAALLGMIDSRKPLTDG